MYQAKHPTGLIFFPAYDWEISPAHPERKERLLYTHDQVLEEGLLDIQGIHEFKAGLASDEDINRVHFCVPDINRHVTASHRISAGGCIEAARLVLEGQVKKAFALVRPPGHHAMRVVPGARGFCVINIEAVMVEWVRTHYPHIKKIAIVDTDCHHGDGTQDIFWHDPNVLFISLHQDGRTLYPGSGFSDELGGPCARGMNINIPLPPRTGDEGFLYVMERLVRPILDDFKPDLVINSAGQDNHYSDPITQMAFTAQGYARLTEILSPDICVLEGGYSIETALPYVNTGIILALAGVDYSYVAEPDYGPDMIAQDPNVMPEIRHVCAATLRTWRERSWYPRPRQPFMERRKNIFYDTDNISETQIETLRVCDCPGVIRIDSRASNGLSARCIHVARGACETCRRQGKAWFDEQGYETACYYQDAEQQEYLTRMR